MTPREVRDCVRQELVLWEGPDVRGLCRSMSDERALVAAAAEGVFPSFEVPHSAFGYEPHGAVYAALKAGHDVGAQPTVSDVVGILARVGWRGMHELVAELMCFEPMPCCVDSAAKRVMEAADARRVQDAARKLDVLCSQWPDFDREEFNRLCLFIGGVR
jgi:hypothetical protein